MENLIRMKMNNLHRNKATPIFEFHNTKLILPRFPYPFPLEKLILQGCVLIISSNVIGACRIVINICYKY